MKIIQFKFYGLITAAVFVFLLGTVGCQNRTAENSGAGAKVQTAQSPVVGGAATTQKSDAKTIDFDFTDFSGKARKLSEFRGKIVLLDFWATWCAPCLADIPKLKTFYDKHKAEGFEIVGMDAETLGDDAAAADAKAAKDAAARAKQIVSTRGVDWTVATSETALPAAKEFQVESLPTKILIGRDGKVIARIGEKDDLAGVVEKLLAENK